ncbi:MAG: hypothetical protein Kilf2KO_12420 [Rhodospirillales bacterium]
MRHAGLLAHSPDGSALAFLEFCHAGPERFGAQLHPDITSDYIAVGHALPAWDRGDVAAVREILARSIARLAAAGADFFFCPDNTAHIALEADGEPLALPGLNIAGIVAASAKARGLTKLAILGTRFTMGGPVYPRALGALGIDWVIPEEADREAVDRIIFDELALGVLREESRARYCAVIDRLRDAGCDGAALVCTEIPLLISEADSNLPLLDSTRLIARAAFELAVGEAPLPTWRGGPL